MTTGNELADENRSQASASGFPITGIGSSPRASLLFDGAMQQAIEGDESLGKYADELADNVTLTVAPKTMSGKQIQQTRGLLSSEPLNDYRPLPEAQQKAVTQLKSLGFQVIREGRFGITVRASARLVKEVLKEDLLLLRRPRRSRAQSEENFTAEEAPPRPRELFVAPRSSMTIKSTVSDSIDDFVFTPPALLCAPPTPPAATPPAGLGYHYMTEATIRSLLRVPNPGPTGAGVSVAVVDTGFQTNHPYYQSRGYQFAAVSEPGGTQPTHDPVGHGTAVTWNVFAVAPGAAVTGIKFMKPPYQDALEIAAEDHGAKIISCSWCFDYEQSFPMLEASIKYLVEELGVVVLFAAGNGHQAWPASMPQVISVGGVFADQQNNLQVSSYASGFISSLYPPRRVPDVSGLCGQGPKAIYIPMPCPAGCTFDDDQWANGANFPNGDETMAQDGWTVASGTSSATPQVAGVIALLLEQAQSKGTVLTPAQVRGLLEQTAQPVTQGRNAFGFPAVGQPNVACGHGLVDATQLLTLARSQGLI